MDVILNWVLRGLFYTVGAGAAIWMIRWILQNWRGPGERWVFRVALGMLLLAGIYTAGHARLLVQREEIEEGRRAYQRFGDPRRTEQRRAEVRGWIMDCTGDPERALAVYRERDGVVERTYPIGQAGANLVGGGADADERDFTVERLFSEKLREPRSIGELGELHPAGEDMRLTVCSDLTANAWELLRQTRRPGAVVMQDVATGEVVAYAATGDADDAPYGIKRYAPPGSVFKLALVALWYEAGMPDDIPIPCPPSIQVTPRARIQNAGGRGLGTVIGPRGMLIPSCNTAAIWMALRMRDEIGAARFVEAYQRYGFETYEKTAPRDSVPGFWATDSEAWAERMSPPVSRVRISENTGRAEWAQLSIGQGPIDATVIGISRFMQAIGNGGMMLPPRIEAEVEADVEARRIMPAEVAGKLMTDLVAIVHEGTGRAALQYLQGTGWNLGGKTGTAQLPGRDDDGWFAGVMVGPDQRPKYTVVVYLTGGGPGSGMPVHVAGSLTRAAATREARLAREADR